MIFAFDTYYYENKAKTVCLGFDNWESEKHSIILESYSEIEGEYVSGEFFKRELPCIQKLIRDIKLSTGDIILIDGYVYVDDFFAPGLGKYLFDFLENKYPVIGVAKNNFSKLGILKKEVYRGDSKKPLFVSSIGIQLTDACENITRMKGNYRIPNLLKQVDQLTRQN